MPRVTSCGKPYHTYTITAANGVSACCDARTMLGAKREASAWIGYGGKSVTVTDNITSETWYRSFWESGHKFGWGKWERVC
jgi:hypothetical protein